jgi:photosystem II stability/assembly factor-like uncharacterized protein
MNGGASWSRLSPELSLGSVQAVAINPQNPNTLYVGTAPDHNGGGGVLKSTDGGMTWVGTGLTMSNVHALAIDPQNPSIVYAGTDGGVFKTFDGGANWSAINSGLTALSVSTLTINALNSITLYAGTYAGGVFEMTDHTPQLSIDAAQYCVGTPWNLKLSNAPPGNRSNLFGTSNGRPWEIADWRKTDASGGISEKGTFAEGTEGQHTLHLETTDSSSNPVSFAVASCKP